MRKLLAIYLAKITALVIRLLGLGSGSALPGRLALFLYPSVLESLIEEHPSSISVVVSGTNGKTTTTGLLKQILSDNGYPKINCNQEGANLYYGVVTAFLLNTDYRGRLKSPDYIIEADEAALSSITKVLKPSIIIITNLFRDQLDRFGELDSTQKLISKGIEAASSDCQLILNANDPRVSALAPHSQQRHLFQVESTHQISNLDAQNLTSLNSYPYQSLTKIKVEHEGLEGSDLKISSNLPNSYDYSLALSLPGLYNAYNFAAAASAAQLLGISPDAISKSVQNYHSEFGRAEKYEIHGLKVQSFLIKNPTGCTEVLKLLEQSQGACFMIAINDNYADSRDVSWLWDAEWERLRTTSGSKFICSGHRAEDMALRLAYAEIPPEDIRCIEDLDLALKSSLEEASKRQSPLYILPTYTALLNLKKSALLCQNHCC